LTTTATAQAQIATRGQVYMRFTVTDPLDSTLDVAIGGSFYTTPSSGVVVYPCVSDWGSLRKYMPSDGRPRDGEVGG